MRRFRWRRRETPRAGCSFPTTPITRTASSCPQHHPELGRAGCHAAEQGQSPAAKWTCSTGMSSRAKPVSCAWPERAGASGRMSCLRHLSWATRSWATAVSLRGVLPRRSAAGGWRHPGSRTRTDLYPRRRSETIAFARQFLTTRRKVCAARRWTMDNGQGSGSGREVCLLPAR